MNKNKDTTRDGLQNTGKNADCTAKNGIKKTNPALAPCTELTTIKNTQATQNTEKEKGFMIECGIDKTVSHNSHYVNYRR